MKRKLYTISSLCNDEFTNEDLHLLFDLNCFNLSLIHEMLLSININKSIEEICALVKEDNWMEKYTWDKKHWESFKKKVINSYKHVYYYSDFKSEREASNWMFSYGLKVKNKYMKRKR